ncbi:hypothetical protein M0811_03350 [Anaeramoeba ignava]|uniref:PAS domain-containing protein n=1 Tax=Anaeramoeba ignava TaxID=1746090 RepID=A0A9Q0L6K9_ANAIG|nr:hypothetical protein M0811_03350 [Anaeramoeba ignava]
MGNSTNTIKITKKQTKKYFRELQQAKEAVLILNQSGLITFMNQSFVQFFGLDNPKIFSNFYIEEISSNFQSFYSTDFENASNFIFSKAKSSEQSLFQFPWTFSHKKGEITLSCCISFFLNDTSDFFAQIIAKSINEKAQPIESKLERLEISENEVLSQNKRINKKIENSIQNLKNKKDVNKTTKKIDEQNDIEEEKPILIRGLEEIESNLKVIPKTEEEKQSKLNFLQILNEAQKDLDKLYRFSQHKLSTIDHIKNQEMKDFEDHIERTTNIMDSYTKKLNEEEILQKKEKEQNQKLNSVLFQLKNLLQEKTPNLTIPSIVQTNEMEFSGNTNEMEIRRDEKFAKTKVSIIWL